MRIRIALIASGSRGDVQPYVALGTGLRAAGHHVRLVSHENFRADAAAHGLDFWPVRGDVQAIAQSEAITAQLEKGNFLRLLRQMAVEAKRAAVAMAEDALAGCQGMDLLSGGLGGLYIGLAVAEKLRLPFLQAHLLPFTPTRAFPSVLTSGLPGWTGPLLNRASHHLARQVMWQGLRAADRAARRDVLGLPTSPFLGPYGAAAAHGLPVLYGFSPSVIPPPPDWAGRAEVTGYWFLDAGDWSPPAGLLDFLESGPAPIYVGFGSMSSRNPEETTALVLEAIRQSKQRALLVAGWSGMRPTTLPESVMMIESAPHAWLFPQVAAVVHHGGAGTTAAGMRAGVPSIVIPFFGDQPFWGRRVARLGVGPEPIARKKLTAARLAEAIERAVADAPMRQRAAALGARIRGEDGVGRAAAIIGELERGLPGAPAAP